MTFCRMLRVESVFAPRAVVGVGKGRGTVEVTLDAALWGVVVDVVSVTPRTNLFCQTMGLTSNHSLPKA